MEGLFSPMHLLLFGIFGLIPAVGIFLVFRLLWRLGSKK
jgi:hypothetical protein